MLVSGDRASAGGGSAAPPDTASSSFGSDGLMDASSSSSTEPGLSGFCMGASSSGSVMPFTLPPRWSISADVFLSFGALDGGDGAGVGSIACSGTASTTSALLSRSSPSCVIDLFSSRIAPPSWSLFRLKPSLRSAAVLPMPSVVSLGGPKSLPTFPLGSTETKLVRTLAKGPSLNLVALPPGDVR